MAGEFKLTKKVADEAVDLLKQVKAEGKLDDLASKVGLDVEVLNEIAEKGASNVKGGKGILRSIVENLGGAIEGVQTEVNTLLGRRRNIPEGGVPPPAAGAIEVVGQIPEGAGKGFRMIPGSGEPGGGGPLARTAEILESQTVDPSTRAPTSSETALTTVPGYVPTREPLISQEEISKSAAAGQARAQAEGASRKRRLEAQDGGGGPAAREELSALGEAGIPLDLTLPKGLKVGATVVGGAAALVGAGAALKNYVQRPEAQKETPTLVATGVDSTEAVSDTVQKTATQMEPDKAQQLQVQAKEVLTLQDALERALAAERSEEKKEKERLALYRLLDRVAEGVTAALGSYALLNKGSLYAPEFDKGPKIDWDAKFKAVQSEYQGLRNDLINRYKIDMRAQEREEEQALEREKLGIQKEGKRQAQRAEEEAKREATMNKLQGSLAVAMDEATPPGRLLTEKKSMVTAGASLIGQKQTDALLQQALDEAKANRGFVTSIKEFLGMDVKMKPEEQAKVTRRFAELLGQSVEGGQAPAVDNMVTVTVNGQAGKIPKDQLEAFRKQYPNAEVQ